MDSLVEGRLAFYYDDNADYYRLLLDDDGVLNIHTKAEHPSTSTTDSLTLNLYNSSGSYLQTWRVPVGASSVAANGLATTPCKGNEQLYFLLIQSDACGTSYQFSYDVSPPLYADDAEDNDGAGTADTVAVNVPHEGRINFYYDDNADQYRLILNDDGVLNIHTMAEHPSTSTTDSLTLSLFNINGTFLQNWRVPVGANGSAANGLATTPCRGNEQLYYLLIQSDACGTSYQFSYDVTSPMFGDDMEPNDGSSTAQVIDLDKNAEDGRINFYYDDNGDQFKLVLPAQGAITMDILAERPGDAGSMNLNLYNVNGTYLETAAIAVGGGSAAASTTFTSAIRPAGTYYILLGSAPCGTSYQIQCNDDDNDGTCNFYDLCPGGPEPGTPCDDGTACTTGDVIDANCNCVGTPVLVDDGDPCTLDSCDPINGVTHTFQDSDGDGTCDANDLCPGGPEPGTTCDDGDPNTSGDMIDANCNCTGTLPCTPGATCDDGDACTTGDVYDANCNCAGTFQDSDNDGTCDANDLCPGGPEPGTACDDGDPNTSGDMIDANCNCTGTLPCTPGATCDDGDACTTGDVYDANCNCAGTFQDSDNDGTCDANDQCPGGPEPGTACDDGDPNTNGDMIDASCNCVGTLVGNCTGNQVVVAINTDNNPDQLTWEITDASNAVVATGGPTAGQTNTLVTDTACLGSTPASACYTFHLMDSFGDGLSGSGNWKLKTTSGKVLLGDDFASGSESPSATPANPNYPGHVFCLPEGSADIIPDGTCGIFNHVMLHRVYATHVAGASLYQFEFTDPDAGFIRRIAKPTNSVLFYDMHTVPLVPGVKYFARVRTNANGPLATAHFGAGCEMGLGIPENVHCTQLIEAPAYGHSCGEERAFGASNSFIYAVPVLGAEAYNFRIYNTSEGYDETFTRNTYILHLKWNASVAPPLVNGSTYNVEMSVVVNGINSGPCPSTCTVTINNNPGVPRPEASMAQRAFGNATLWPNPVRENQVNLSLSGIQDADQDITVDIQDIYGKQVFAKAYGNSGERFSTILDLPGDIASGVYMVNITVNGKRSVQRLSIMK